MNKNAQSIDLKGLVKRLEEEAKISDPIFFSEVAGEEIAHNPKEQPAWKDLKIEVEVILGTALLKPEKMTALKKGSIIILEELADEFVDIYINGKKLAKGKITIVEEQYAVQIVEILEKKDRI